MAKTLDSEVENLLLSLLLGYNIPEPTHSGPPFPSLYMDMASQGSRGYASLFQRLWVLGSAGVA